MAGVVVDVSGMSGSYAGMSTEADRNAGGRRRAALRRAAPRGARFTVRATCSARVARTGTSAIAFPNARLGFPPDDRPFPGDAGDPPHGPLEGLPRGSSG